MSESKTGICTIICQEMGVKGPTQKAVGRDVPYRPAYMARTIGFDAAFEIESGRVRCLVALGNRKHSGILNESPNTHPRRDRDPGNAISAGAISNISEKAKPSGSLRREK